MFPHVQSSCITLNAFQQYARLKLDVQKFTSGLLANQNLCWQLVKYLQKYSNLSPWSVPSIKHMYIIAPCTFFWLFLVFMFILNLINTLSIVESNISIINERKKIIKNDILKKNTDWILYCVRGRLMLNFKYWLIQFDYFAILFFLKNTFYTLFKCKCWRNI